jgi:addiction module RelE/StbE family toxin
VKLRWSARAARHLVSIEAYIARDKPEAAARVVAKIVDSAFRLEQFPNMGHTGRIAGSRELIVPNLPYIVAYRVVGDVIDISSIVHTSRKWPEKV